MFHESEVSIQTWENVGRVSYSEMSLVHPSKFFWQQHHALIGIWSIRVNTCSASFLRCALCLSSHEEIEEIGTKNLELFESIVAMAISPLKKNRLGGVLR